MFSLPCEIIASIVSDNCTVWTLLAIYNDNFMRYTIENRKQFINLFTVIEEDEDSIVYMLFNRFHREDDLPAVIQNNGCNEWWINGMRHRDTNNQGESLPALIYDDTQEWWWCGMRHRNNDKPAVVSDAMLEWYTNDILIRSKCIKKD